MRIYFRYVLYAIGAAIFFSASAQTGDAAVEFYRAVNVDNAGKVRDMLAAGYDPNSLNRQGQPPLVQAIRDESPKVAEVLLADRRTQVDTPTQANETALMMAALRGDLAWSQRLVAAGAQVNRPGWTPLHYAASGPSEAVVRWLVEQGAALDARSPNGSTPLMMAARYGSIDGARWLLSRGADARLRNQRNLSAADFARSAGREELGAEIDQKAR
jgi:uncharacterized protein